MSGFRVIGDELGASIEVDGMTPEQVAAGLKHVLASVYTRGGVELAPDDLTLLNIVMGELNLEIQKMREGQRRLRRTQWMMWMAVVLNLSIAGWYIVASITRSF